jgi:hypothetical protein
LTSGSLPSGKAPNFRSGSKADLLGMTEVDVRQSRPSKGPERFYRTGGVKGAIIVLWNAATRQVLAFLAKTRKLNS